MIQSFIYNLKHMIRRHKLKSEARSHGFRHRYVKASNQYPMI